MLKEKTMDKEIKLLLKAHVDTRDEGVFLEGALFALQWMKTGVRRTSPSKFIAWRRRNNMKYRAGES